MIVFSPVELNWERTVLESILYFALGFLSATMLALMISPAIWGRAVELTRKQVESSVPLTLNEIQADKDQLRAEFAMSTRRLEMSVEELRDKAARQVIEISRKRDDLARLAEEGAERIRTVEELELRSAELRDKLKEREERLANTSQRLEETRSKLEEKARELDEIRTHMSEARSEVDSARIELVAKQTEVVNMSDQVGDVTRRENELKQEIADLRGEADEIRASRETEQKRAERYERELEKTRKQLLQNEQTLAKRERELSRTRESGGMEEKAYSELNGELLNEKARIVELEAKLAQSALQMEALLNDASNDNVEKAMESLNKDKENLESQLREITVERDRLREELSGQEREKSDDWESERRENAILRERINDLAAQVTAMTAALEGNESAINGILASAPSLASHQRKSDLIPPDESLPAQKTLADRIRALQETARQVKTG
jgi:chromosome segregation ATPase